MKNTAIISSSLSHRRLEPDSRPRYGIGTANAWSAGPAALLASLTAIPGSVNGGRAGTFSLQTTSTTYGWLAVKASETTTGIRVNDGFGFGGWNGAGLAGNNDGESPDPCVSTVLYTDLNNVTWRLFRHDYIDSNPEPSNYTIL